MTTSSPAEPIDSPGRSQPFLSRLQDWLLLTALVAIGLGYTTTRQRMQKLNADIAVMLRVGRVLVVEDSTKIAVISNFNSGPNRHSWKLHIPAGQSYKLALASGSKITGRRPSEPSASCVLPSGTHEVELSNDAETSQTEGKIVVVVDAKIVMEQDFALPAQSASGISSFTTGGSFPEVEVFEPNRPPTLLSRTYRLRSLAGRQPTPSQPASDWGIMLWIE